MKKTELARQIKKFMYDYKFKDGDTSAKVISSCYLKSLLIAGYKDNSKIPPYSIILGDFNKLNDLNLQYGFREGDKCFKKAIYIISKVLPKNALICRYGGDEFLFILPGIIEEEKIKEYEEKIEQILQINSKQLHDLSITLEVANSNEGKSLSDVYAILDEKINEKKLNSQSEDNFYQAFSTFYSALRLSPNFKFDINQIKKLIIIAMETTYEMLQEYQKTGKFINEEANIYKELSKNYKSTDSENISLTTERAMELNELFINNDILSEKQLEKVTEEELKQIAQDLVIAYEPMAFSRDYYEYYLKDTLPNDKKYRVVLLSLSGLKLSNLIMGHNRTDNYLHDVIYKNVKENIDNQKQVKKDLCMDIFNPNGKIYKIAIGGADILYIEPEDSRYRPKDEWYRNNDNEKLLKYVKISVTHPISKDEIMDWISYAGVNSKVRKDVLKRELFETQYATELGKACLKTSLEKYCQEHPEDYMDSNNIKEFINKQCEEMFRFKNIMEAEPKKTTFVINDIHFDYSYNDANEQKLSEKGER